MNRLIGVALTLGLMTSPAASAQVEAGQPSFVQPSVTLLDMHPADMRDVENARPAAMSMPQVIRQGAAASQDSRQVEVPVVLTPSKSDEDPLAGLIGKAGTGFFIASNGTLLTAAHVVNGCGRMQVISKYVPRSWASLVAADDAHDIAILNVPGLHSPSVLRLAAAGPSGDRLRILGFPAAAGLTAPATAWAVVQNHKFPPNIGPMANPRDLLWMSAPDVTHGFSGGPIFDPKRGAVVGIVKGEVDGGYLRLVRDMPTAGMAIGPGVEHIQALLRRHVPYAAAVSLVSSQGEAGDDILHRATVHVLCWR